MAIVEYVAIHSWDISDMIVYHDLSCIVNELNPAVIIHRCKAFREYPCMTILRFDNHFARVHIEIASLFTIAIAYQRVFT